MYFKAVARKVSVREKILSKEEKQKYRARRKELEHQPIVQLITAERERASDFPRRAL